MSFKALIGLPVLCLALAGCGDKNKVASSHKEEEKNEEAHEKEGSHEKKEEVITLSPEARKNIRLVTTPATFNSVREKITATATISHNQDRLFHVTPPIDGRVLDVYVSVGSAVGRGGKLALLDSTTLGETRSELLKAKTFFELTKANYEREQSLFEQRIAAKKDVLTAEAEYRKAEAEVKSLEGKLRLYGFSSNEISSPEASSSAQFIITAPASGIVTEKDVSQGEVVEARKKLFTISDLSTVWIFVDVYEKDLAKIKNGAGVDLAIDAYGGKPFRGLVDYIGDVVNPETRAVQVRVKVPNPNRQLKPGMFATATFEGPSQESKKAVYLPTTAVFDIKGKKMVFVEEAPGQFHPREVEIASNTGNQAQITKGLKEGDRVVTDGGIYLKSNLLKEELGHGH